MRVLPFLLILTTGLLTQGILLPTTAQVTSDGTTNTTVNPNGNNFTIINGIEKGNNLFHSFSNFSVPTGGSATFDLINTPNITTIFSRVTGGNVSNIDGLIQTLNSNNRVSLFLMNPAGIVFGKDASLNIGGSFVGTTANSIKFADGVEFSAVNLTASPLLTMSVPIGLQMGQNTGALAQPAAGIAVQGNGHHLTAANTFVPATPSATPTGLQVQPGQILALVGGDLGFTGGTLTAPQGQVTIGAVSDGLIGITFSPQGWDFDYSGVNSFRDIQLSQQSMLDASGIGGGRIQVQGANVSLTDGSTLLIQSFGLQSGGGIQVRATDSLTIQGTTPNQTILSGLHTNQLGAIGGSTITVDTRRFSLQQGGEIRANTYASGSSSAIHLDATESTTLTGFTPLTRQVSSISSNSFGAGAAGLINLSTAQLTLMGGSFINSGAFATGNSGNVSVNVDGTINIIGTEPIFAQPSNISAGTIRFGNGGNVSVNAQRINLQAGGRISASTLGFGNGGSLTVNASESITVQGKGDSVLLDSAIEASAPIIDAVTQQLYGVPPLPIGASGTLTINTPRLIVTASGLVSVKNDGTGNAGNLVVNANTILLDRQGSITAATQSGEGGNLQVQANSIILQRGSNINATARGTGNGGNIFLNVPIILGLENSDIVANAEKGRGGNINITTQGIFGLKYRPQLTTENDITTSSEFGVNGNVQIISPDVDLNSGLVQLPENVTDPLQQIATGCSVNTGSSFVATGRGGVPQNPTQEVRSDVYDGLRLRTWSDIRDLSAFEKTGTITAQIPQSPKAIIQATSWHRNPQGQIELVTDKSPAQVQQPLTCAAVTKS
ncbi:S-layer family protein [Nostoc sp. ChiQUE01b]|uniref:S-layer family protein n=1 Tax=Nostoc sp. ChiQUE01b TaxID=3075376 RepID=UPI002AD235A9|nr:S-layer family protein [Nostoc sp. ChiQUE01b]MDZ8260533.1 S-layer family protein [Nostoc sp. ChiQUE01b]